MERSKDDQEAWTRPGLCQTPEWDVLLGEASWRGEQQAQEEAVGLWLMSRTKRATRRIHGSWAQKVLNKFEKNAFHCSILIWQVQKWPLRGQGRGPPWLVEDLETRVPHLDKACEEVSLRSSNEHAGRAGLRLDGLAAKQEKTLFVRRMCKHATPL